MKKVTNFLKLLAFSMIFVFASCESEELDVSTAEPEGVSSALKAKLDGFYLNGDLAEPYTNFYPDGSSEEGILVEDKFFSVEQINAMTNLKDEDNIWTEQYRTNNLVSTPRTISVIGYTGGQFGLSATGRRGLEFAINNYNRLNLRIRFTLRFAASTNADMVIFDNSVNNSGTGGSAGFPTNGRPHKFIQIFGLAGSSNNVNEHVISHEMGHAIGFRHTDFFSRQSCGQNTNEGASGVGAVRIPGTPSGFDSTSIMLACFSNNTNGEFNGNDRRALNFLY